MIARTSLSESSLVIAALIEGVGKWTSSWWGGMLPQPPPGSSETKGVVPSDSEMLDSISDLDIQDSTHRAHYCNLTMRSWIKSGQNGEHRRATLGSPLRGYSSPVLGTT